MNLSRSCPFDVLTASSHHIMSHQSFQKLCANLSEILKVWAATKRLFCELDLLCAVPQSQNTLNAFKIFTSSKRYILLAQVLFWLRARICDLTELKDNMGARARRSEIGFSKLPEISWELCGTLSIQPQHYTFSLAISGLSGKTSCEFTC